jgi:hypothetical protein
LVGWEAGLVVSECGIVDGGLWGREKEDLSGMVRCGRGGVMRGWKGS